MKPDFITAGTTITLGSRTYTARSVEPYSRKDGTASQLVLWEGECVLCAAAFTVKGGRNPKHLAVTCDAHRGGRPKAGPLLKAIRGALSALDSGAPARARELLSEAVGQEPRQ